MHFDIYVKLKYIVASNQNFIIWRQTEAYYSFGNSYINSKYIAASDLS